MYGRDSSVAANVGDPVVVRDELFLAGVGVVDAIDPILRQRRVVGVRRPDVVMLSARFVEIVIQVRAGRHQAVDVAVQDQMRDDQTQTAGGQRARHPQEDRDVVLQHLLPDAVRRREVAPLKRDPLHAREDLIRREPASTANGSIGVCRKRDFFFMRRTFNHKPLKPDPRRRWSMNSRATGIRREC